MLYHARNGSVRVGDSEMDYISFGSGNRNLIMLPGLGDGLSTVKGMALIFFHHVQNIRERVHRVYFQPEK